MSPAGKIMQDSDVATQFAAHRTMFVEQFGLLSTEERLEIWLQLSSQFAAIMISAYTELLATVEGECPSLLDPCRGGSDVLCNLVMDADAALTAYREASK